MQQIKAKPRDPSPLAVATPAAPARSPGSGLSPLQHRSLYLNPKTASTPATCVAVAKKPRVIADPADTLRASSSFLGFLPTWRLTQALEDEHTDCTHYCLDSGVHDAVLDAVAFELSVRVRR